MNFRSTGDYLPSSGTHEWQCCSLYMCAHMCTHMNTHMQIHIQSALNQGQEAPRANASLFTSMPQTEAGTVSEFSEIPYSQDRKVYCTLVCTKNLTLTSYALKWKTPIIFLKCSYGELYLLVFLEYMFCSDRLNSGFSVLYTVYKKFWNVLAEGNLYSLFCSYSLFSMIGALWKH
jgi:hypothetical protein